VAGAAQKYLPPPKPKVLGIDLGTTYSVAAFYHAVRALSGRLSALSVFHNESDF
jgi:stress 70 chaperone-associated protein